jgi:hypothetical protein
MSVTRYSDRDRDNFPAPARETRPMAAVALAAVAASIAGFATRDWDAALTVFTAVIGLFTSRKSHV